MRLNFRDPGALAGIMLLALTACREDTESDDSIEAAGNRPAVVAAQQAGRWYEPAQVDAGRELFAANCAACHGAQAQGLTAAWRQRQPDGNFPPPPLNGSAHAWHHPMVQLIQVIETGGIPYGGQMPAFAEVLSEDEMRATIAYFQSFWDEETYLNWLDRGGLE